MKTDELIAMLATGVAPVAPGLPARRLRAGLLLGAMGALALLLLGYGVRPDLAQAAGEPMLWVKFGFPAALAATAALLVLRLSHPGMRLGALGLGLLLPVLAMLVLAGTVLLGAEEPQRAALLLGGTWKSCSASIALLSSPVFVALLWVLHGLAPTRLRLAGASAGLLAGAVGTFVYAFHCPEMAAPFLAAWYGLGMLVPALLGALLGPRLLRW